MLYGMTLVLQHEKCYNSVRKTPLKSNRMNPFQLPKICQGQMVPHAHKDDVRGYQYLDNEGNKDGKANLCSSCVAFDRNRGYTLERTFIEDKTNDNR